MITYNEQRNEECLIGISCIGETIVIIVIISSIIMIGEFPLLHSLKPQCNIIVDALSS